MMKFLIFFLFAFIQLVYLVPSFGMGVHREGTGAWCDYRCNVTGASFIQTTNEKSTYLVEGQCRYVAVGDAACPPEVESTYGRAEWLKEFKIASEYITGNGKLLVSSTSRCDKNPWHGPASCTLITKNLGEGFETNGPFPLSATILTPQQKETIEMAEMSAPVKIVPPPPPQILEPSHGHKYDIPASIHFKIKHKPDFQLEFETQWKPVQKEGEWPAVFSTLPVLPDGVNTANEITTGTFNINKAGLWQIRARCKHTDAKWSNWRRFEVKEKQDIKILSPQAQKAYSGDINLSLKLTGFETLPPIYFDWWWVPSSKPGQWPSPPEKHNIVNSIGGKTSIVIPRSEFPKSGTWKLRAYVQTSQKLQIYDEVTFVIFDPLKDIKLNLKPH